MRKLLGLLFMNSILLCSQAQIRRNINPLKDKSATPTITTQKPSRSGPGMNRRQALQQLNLTIAQKTRIRDIIKDSKAKIEEIKVDNTLPDKQKKEKLRELRQEQARQVVEVLTPEQRVKLKEIREQNKMQDTETPDLTNQ